MKNRNLFILVNFIILLIFFGALATGAQPLLDQPMIQKGELRAGELLEYSVKVKGIPAGTQVWQVNAKRYLNGHEVYHVKSTSKTNPFFKIFYAFDDQSESFIRRNNFSPIRYERNLIDGKYRGNTAIEFDQIKNVANVVKDKRRHEINVPKGVQDELSMIYLLRTREMKVGESYEFDALMGTKTMEVEVVVLRTEKIKTVLGTIKTIVIKTIPRNATIWITDDLARIPVKIEANTKLGKLVAHLNSIN